MPCDNSRDEHLDIGLSPINAAKNNYLDRSDSNMSNRSTASQYVVIDKKHYKIKDMMLPQDSYIDEQSEATNNTFQTNNLGSAFLDSV